MITDIPYEWLRRKGTATEFERESLQQKARAFNLPLEKVVQKFGTKPFGHMTDNWRNFIAKIEPEDELWKFASPVGMFSKKLGCLGFAIVRDGTIRATLIMMMS